MIALVTAQPALDFAELVRRHQAMVFSLAWRFLRDRGLAEEVAQEVFLSLHRNMGSIQSSTHATAWLRKVTTQRAIDEGRRRQRRPHVAIEKIAEPAASERASGRATDPLMDETLRRLVASLPETPRMIMVLRYQEDLDPSEIAQFLEMPVATVKSHLQRSLALLREKLARRGVGEQ